MAKQFEFRGKTYSSLSDCYTDYQDDISVTRQCVTQRVSDSNCQLCNVSWQMVNFEAFRNI
jgi:hypothetical protein